MFKTAALRFVSEDALLIEFGDELDEAVHQKVLNLDAALSSLYLAPHIESLPTFRSLLIKFDPFTISHDELLEALSEIAIPNKPVSGRNWRVPICFDAQFSQDLGEFSSELDLSEIEVIDRLLARPLELYMYGFASGFAYLGGLDDSLSIPRRATPRSAMPVGSFIVAGGLAGLSSVSLPTGWYVLGQTPVNMFSVRRDPMVPFSIGDKLHLYSISGEAFSRLQTLNQQSGDKLPGIEEIL